MCAERSVNSSLRHDDYRRSVESCRVSLKKQLIVLIVGAGHWLSRSLIVGAGHWLSRSLWKDSALSLWNLGYN